MLDRAPLKASLHIKQETPVVSTRQTGSAGIKHVWPPSETYWTATPFCFPLYSVAQSGLLKGFTWTHVRPPSWLLQRLVIDDQLQKKRPMIWFLCLNMGSFTTFFRLKKINYNRLTWEPSCQPLSCWNLHSAWSITSFYRLSFLNGWPPPRITDRCFVE